MAASRASVTARNSGEVSAARVLGIGSGANAAAPATGVPDVSAAIGEATGVTWATEWRIGAAAAASAVAPASERTLRRENRADLIWACSMDVPPAILRA